MNKAVNFSGLQCRDLAKGMHATCETYLGLEDIADAGHHPLIQQHVRNLRTSLGANARGCIILSKFAAKQIRPEHRNRGMPRQ